ncbi:MAG: hypothetical protein VB835_16275 [Pirellulales bacterium]
MAPIPDKNGLSGQIAAPGAADDAQNTADLEAVIAAWPTLPEAVKANILAMARVDS